MTGITLLNFCEEIRKGIGSQKHVHDLLGDFSEEQKLFVETTPLDRRQAWLLSPKNVSDALHVVLAKKAGAVYLVTRDLKDF
jgi:predicted nucleic acid-binding protein